MLPLYGSGGWIDYRWNQLRQNGTSGEAPSVSRTSAGRPVRSPGGPGHFPTVSPQAIRLTERAEAYRPAGRGDPQRPGGERRPYRAALNETLTGAGARAVLEGVFFWTSGGSQQWR